MRNVYIVGGQQKAGALTKAEWHCYERGLVVRLDLDTGDLEGCVEYVSPPEVVPDEDPSVVFKAAALRDDRFFVCTQTEILIYSFPDFEQVGYVSLPCFNDIHHVTPSRDGNLLVANTGLDMVVEVTPDGDVRDVWNVLGQEPWERFSESTDYRKVSTTKPHLSHPNYVFELDGEVWATRFEQRDAVRLPCGDERIPIDVQRPHDGRVVNGHIYFTTVDGHVVIVDAARREVSRVLALQDLTRGVRKLGWCRGIEVLDERYLLVGFSRLRPTRWRDNLAWISGDHEKALRSLAQRPARVVLLDLEEERIVREYPVEEAGLGAVFSVHAAP